MKIELRQRGRASIDFVSAVAAATAKARKLVGEELRAAGVSSGSLPDDLQARRQAFDAALAAAPSYSALHALREWGYLHHGRVAMDSFDELRDEIVPSLQALSQGTTTLEATLGDAVPKYFRGVEFHRTGSWDAHDYMGTVHGEIVHRRLVARNFGGDIYEQRRGMLDELQRPDYPRILEIGVSSGNLTVALSQRFPDAAITGIDVSLRMLEHAQRLGNERGQSWRLFQRAAEATGFADSSFDLVTGYALGHEVPAAAMQAILQEAFRVLAPGGELLLGDVVPFHAQDKLTQAWADHEAQHGGEPYWQEYCAMDLARLAQETGFDAARYFYANCPRRFPYILHARKATQHPSALKLTSRQS